MYKTSPIEWVLVFSDIKFKSSESGFKLGLNFQPPTTIISSKKIIILTNMPTGTCEDPLYKI